MKKIYCDRIKGTYLFFLLLMISGQAVTAGPDNFRASTRYDYYTHEKNVEILLWVPAKPGVETLSFEISSGENILLSKQQADTAAVNHVIIDAGLFKLGTNSLRVTYFENDQAAGTETLTVILREHRFNAVKVDRLSGGLIVEGLPYYAFGFYTYSPVQQGLPAAEVVKGFNMMSPYQQIKGRNMKERQAYMDRCAALGMKVNYNISSLAGGGGPASAKHKPISYSRRIKLLRKEIEAFRDHPALLSWYISDEPVGQEVSPDSLQMVYNIIKDLDPYHPVTIVFMTPQMADDYSDVMDIVMADPYPVPHASVEEVGDVAAMLSEMFFLDKPVWIVPQAFGGNEWWEREPTRLELRAMTYLALVNNAMGIQYFIRYGLNAFPKSTAAWNECGAMALEFAEITPYLFSAEPRPTISSDDEHIQFRGARSDGAVIVIAVNTSNKPSPLSFTVDDLRYQGSARVLFEDRTVDVIMGRVEDMIGAYGSKVYEIMYKNPMSKGPKVHPANMIEDGSFEDDTGLGIPASCYARPQGDRGATYFTDSRVSVRGSRSLRMTTPEPGQGMALSFYGQRIEPGRSYTISIQAKALPHRYRSAERRGFFKRLCGCGPGPDDFPEFSLSLGDECKAWFIAEAEWQEYSFSCIPKTPDGKYTVSPGLELSGRGTAWFDLLQMYPDMEMRTRLSPEENNIDIHLVSKHRGAEIYYTTDGRDPGPEDTRYTRVFSIDRPATIKAVAIKDGRKTGYLEQYLVTSYATGRYVDYEYDYSPTYDAGLKDGLVDGILGTPDFKDGRWQGFDGVDLDVELNLRTVRPVKEIRLRFLETKSSWIFLPEDVQISWSADGREYHVLEATKEVVSEEGLPGIYTYVYAIEEGIDARYFRIRAQNIGTCPPGHPGEGSSAWLFTDEIIIR